jgi:adenylosuccinate lyase
MVPPNDHDLVERFLKDSSFLLVSPNAYNSLGLGLTQLYNTTWVYNHKRHGEFFLNGKKLVFKLKSAFPVTISKEYLVIDLINNLEELAEDQEQIVKNFQKNVNRFEASELVKVAQQYGSGRTKKLVKSVLRKTQLIHV